jgi:hypothetical protein
MGKAFELVTCLATAPSAGTAGVALTNNSLVIRDTRKKVRAVAAWRTGQAAGFARVTSPLMHDAVVGTHWLAPTGSSLLVAGMEMDLQAQDTLNVQMGGSAVAGDIEHFSLLVFYDDLPGADGNFITAATLRKRMVDYYASTNTIATSTTGQYGGFEKINQEQDQLRANTEYAVLGATVQVGVHAVRWVGPDWANIGFGFPAGAPGQWESGLWFLRLAEATGLPVIPVFNSSNKSLINLDAATDENGVDASISTMMARLA